MKFDYKHHFWFFSCFSLLLGAFAIFIGFNYWYIASVYTRFLGGLSWILVYMCSFFLLGHPYVASCSKLQKGNRNYKSDIQEIFLVLVFGFKLLLKFCILYIFFVTWFFMEAFLPFESWIAISCILFYSSCFCCVVHFKSFGEAFKIKIQEVSNVLRLKKGNNLRFTLAKMKVFFQNFRPASKKDLVFLICLVIFKLMASSSLTIGLLLVFSLRCDQGLSVCIFYWLLLALTIVVFLPSVQNHIKTTYGSRCFRYLGWNPGSAALNGGKIIAGTGAGLAVAGAADTVVSVVVNKVENAVGESQHNKNVAAHDAFIEKIPHSDRPHPGPYVQKPVESIVRRISNALGITLPPAEPSKTNTHLGRDWGYKKPKDD